MGAQQSSSRGTATSDSSSKKTDYYDLLGVDRQATDEEIKKAYRKKALELHPDRNYGDVENATQKFAEVQAAYEVLSDPQERAWYDSHRDAILRGDDPADSEATPEYHNVRITTADDIYTLIGRFNKSVPLDDSPNSFFTILQDTFDRIVEAEDAAAEWDGLAPTQYPSFGSSKDDDKIAKAFYSRWSNFSTRLSFAWKDKWRLSDAPDRRVRRLMEKENKKFREEGVREFNDAVRSLVAFVRKRDPRYVPNTQSEAERQKTLRDTAAAQAARSRAANQQKLNDPLAVPEWARSQGDDLYQGEFSETDEESEVEHIECVVCNKIFKSEKQYEAHEKSKKHVKAVQQLQRQMKKENASLDLYDDALQTPTTDVPTIDDDHADDDDDDDAVASTVDTPHTDDSSRLEAASRTDTEAASSRVPTVDSEDESEDDDYASRDAVEARLVSGQGDKWTSLQGAENPVDDLAGEVDDVSLTSGEPTKKVGKAKAKREKKAARQAALELQDDQKCTACNTNFDSRTKLFKHLKETGHAATKAVTSKPSKKKR
ncbi:DnaJ-domain-containing protein [Hypoxylon rubiginosum]|uniref:DnaJ-domain-containing protein n=1 Tax=Hypoxylon rubiginosum TaxID=110542 RepID=A0ACB9YYF5_9PEZI|nr:DnaJ-domain-containing protein [Hypoxylon rubiginosum]